MAVSKICGFTMEIKSNWKSFTVLNSTRDSLGMGTGQFCCFATGVPRPSSGRDRGVSDDLQPRCRQSGFLEIEIDGRSA